MNDVTIGGRNRHEGVLIIGNNVMIGAYSILLGPINVGNNATIAVGAVVINDMPDDCVVAEIPTKIIKNITN